MKKIYNLLSVALLAMVAFGVAGCSDDDKKSSYDQLPAASKAFLEAFYPGIDVKEVHLDTSNGVQYFDVKLKNGHEIDFSLTGEWIAVDAPDGQIIPEGIVPMPIQAYLDATYPSYGVNEIERTHGGGYVTTLLNGVELAFDSEGQYVGFVGID